MTEVFCFTPSNADYTLVDGYILSFYDTELDNPYDVENSDEKIDECVESLDFDEYELREDERWVRFDYESISKGDPQRL